MSGGDLQFSALPSVTLARPGKSSGVQPSGKASWGMRLRLWRNRQIASAAFRRLMARLPLTRQIANRKANQLFALTSGFIHSQILWTCVRLGIFDALAGTWASTDALAERCGLPPGRMRLLLAQAERLKLIASVGPDLWMLDDAGAVVAADRGLSEMILHHDMLYRDLLHPDRLLAGDEGETELSRYWSYVRGGDRDISADAVAPYSGLMRESQTMMADCILAAHDFERYNAVLDVGGGDGAFLAAAGDLHPYLDLHLFDLEPVADRAQTHLQSLGLGPRSTVHGGNFVEDRIPDSCDCVTLIRILCDHDDDRVQLILANLYRSLKPGTRLVVAEAMAGPSAGAQLAAVYFSIYFLAMGSGRCRTQREIVDLLGRAGFRKAHAVGTSNPLIATLVVAER